MGELIFGTMCFVLGCLFGFMISCVLISNSRSNDYIWEEDEDDEDDG